MLGGGATGAQVGGPRLCCSHHSQAVHASLTRGSLFRGENRDPLYKALHYTTVCHRPRVRLRLHVPKRQLSTKQHVIVPELLL